MSVTIAIPTALRQFTDGQSEISVEASTVQDALVQLTTTYLDLQKHLFIDGTTLRSFVNVYVNEDNIRQKNGLDTSLKDGDTVLLIPSIAGGCCYE
jgi:sulfur-carrier protein adenylyltransferase/sulfurtransferase